MIYLILKNVSINQNHQEYITTKVQRKFKSFAKGNSEPSFSITCFIILNWVKLG